MLKPTVFDQITDKAPGYYVVVGLLAVAIAIGLVSAYTMETSGHHITGMSNRIVWGMPHVFAVFLIVAASGALNAASISSVFGRTFYKPLARISGVTSIALLIGGLSVLVLDLGRPDRLIVAMTTYNFKSIFAWNIFLYTGFMVIVVVYLWMMMERRMARFTKAAGMTAFLWRLALTTGTGSIFGFLVARQAYDAAIMAPLFIAMSLSLGMAVFTLVLFSIFWWSGKPIGSTISQRLGRLLGILIAAVLYFVIAQHLTNLYATEHHGIERFILIDGGVYTHLFWWGQILIGSLIPMYLLFKMAKCPCMVMGAAGLVIVGGFAQIYVIIIGGQAYPLLMFPGMEVTSSFFDGGIAAYAPSLPEVLLGLGGGAIALLGIALAVKTLPVLPHSLANADIDPDYTPPPEPEPEPEKEEAAGEDDEAPEAAASS
ncbi:MAG: polysulfide reductase NrfD [Proteobacteria bacterium]|nr:polysulfide reductase NrfD [Pseudomonadota bacterium]MDA1021857.1 polysulfide reductase NrfD [Pseudomonadota bacterium]